jgi:hypothetical protein
MNFREWIAENIGYRVSGCAYAKTHDHIFDFVRSVTPQEYLGRDISDLGCGDGQNTLRIQKVFNAEKIKGFEKHDTLVKRARVRGLNVTKWDLEKDVPKGEMATFSFALHHIKDKEKCLTGVKRNFRYIFMVEPCNDLYHRLFDAGYPMSESNWKELFDKVFKKYKIFKYKNNLVVFYRKF